VEAGPKEGERRHQSGERRSYLVVVTLRGRGRSR
jgi:hypothetical protein